jgi:hypothetical protein
MGQYRNYNDDDLIKAVERCHSLSEVIRELHLKVAGGNFDTIRRKIAKLNLDTSHFTGQLWSKGKNLKDWSEYRKDSGRKTFLISERGYKCEVCNLIEWQGFPIVLELHHIDGNRTNNEKENLQLLCCNCHAITDNWRNKKKAV